MNEKELRQQARSPEGIKAELAIIERLARTGLTEAVSRLQHVDRLYGQLSTTLKQGVTTEYERVSRIVNDAIEALLEKPNDD